MIIRRLLNVPKFVFTLIIHSLKQLSMINFNCFVLDPYCALWCVFLWELPQMRFTEKQLNKRLASHELTSEARECSAGQTSVQLLLCPTSCGCSQKKTSHRVQYGILRSTICNSLAHIHAHAHMCLSLLLAATTFARRDHFRSPRSLSLAAITLTRRSKL